MRLIRFMQSALTPCSLVKNQRRFGGTHCFCLQSRRVIQVNNRKEASSKQSKKLINNFCFEYLLSYMIIGSSDEVPVPRHKFGPPLCCNFWLQDGVAPNVHIAVHENQFTVSKVEKAVQKYIKTAWGSQKPTFSLRRKTRLVSEPEMVKSCDVMNTILKFQIPPKQGILWLDELFQSLKSELVPWSKPLSQSWTYCYKTQLSFYKVLIDRARDLWPGHNELNHFHSNVTVMSVILTSINSWYLIQSAKQRTLNTLIQTLLHNMEPITNISRV